LPCVAAGSAEGARDFLRVLARGAPPVPWLVVVLVVVCASAVPAVLLAAVAVLLPPKSSMSTCTVCVCVSHGCMANSLQPLRTIYLEPYHPHNQLPALLIAKALP